MIQDFDNVPELPTIMGPAKQIAYMVNDIDEAMKQWNKEYDVGHSLYKEGPGPGTLRRASLRRVCG